MNVNNPYVEAQLEMDGPVYHGEIHAAPITDRNDAPPELTTGLTWMLEPSYWDPATVEDALGHISDCSLEVEVKCWNVLKKKTKRIQDQIQEREDQLFITSMDQHTCHKRLEEARVIGRVQEEMQRAHNG
jgi:hypothetical protein